MRGAEKRAELRRHGGYFTTLPGMLFNDKNDRALDTHLFDLFFYVTVGSRRPDSFCFSSGVSALNSPRGGGVRL